MERPACKLCHRRFPNGRALGGHMRSHVAAGAAAPAAPARPRVLLLPDSSASSASASDGEDEDGKGSGQSYGLRENPKKSFRLVDPEFSSSSFAAAMYTGSSAAVVLQDGESETESPRAAGPPCHRRRSKRPRPSTVCPPPPQAEPEPVSSVSDATPEEDVAVSLMMLSRDVWTRSSSVNGEQQLLQSEAADDQIAGAGSRGLYEPEQEESDEQKRTKFQCETCRKVFKSYQALGGHRASHKKLKQSCARATPDQFSIPNSDANADRGSSSKVHECPICLRVFGSGQALGGHKRSHLCYATAASSPSIPPPPIPQAKSPMIDLNLPAPIEDEAAELSVVSDAEFLTSHH